MTACRICGEEKDPTQFHKIKNGKAFSRSKNWCKDCQKMWAEKRKQELQQKELDTKKWIFSVSFH